MSLPSSVGLPNECMLGNLDYSLPPDAKSMSIKVQPSNLSSIVSSTYSTGTTAGAVLDLQFPSQNIIFDLPAGSSPSTFLDNRFTTLNFRMNIAVSGTAGATSTMTTGFLRSNANSFFDRMYITSQNGQIIEDITEYGLVNDTILNLQMNNSVRDGISSQYGFASVSLIESQGHPLPIFTGRQLATGDTTSNSYSVPLLSGSIGCLSDKFLNIGRTSKLQVVLQTTSVLPLSITCNSVANATSFVVTLSDFSLQCEYVDIGLNALKMLDQTLVDGKAYIHGTTYRTSTATLPASITGSTSLLAGIRASSVKSLFARWFEGGALSTTNSSSGKYDGKNPLINNIQFNVGGVKYPQTPINPLLNPSQAFAETQKAIGSFNNSQFQSSITPQQYCKLSTGGTSSGLTSSTQDVYWNTGSSPDKQCLFIFGENVEVCARRGLLSGLNCTSAPVFVEANIASAPTNSHTMYVMAMLDQVLIHDVNSGDISVRI